MNGLTHLNMLAFEELSLLDHAESFYRHLPGRMSPGKRKTSDTLPAVRRSDAFTPSVPFEVSNAILIASLLLQGRVRDSERKL